MGSHTQWEYAPKCIGTHSHSYGTPLPLLWEWTPFELFYYLGIQPVVLFFSLPRRRNP